MRIRPTVLAIALVVGHSLSVQAQQVPDKSRGDAQLKQDATRQANMPNVHRIIPIRSVVLPPGENAWAVQIISQGGFTGAGRGNLIVASDGSIVWTNAEDSCSRTLEADTVAALTRLVGAANSPFPTAALAGFCGDCYFTTMIVQRHEADGVTRTLTFSWDDATLGGLPSDAVKLYETLMTHKGCKL